MEWGERLAGAWRQQRTRMRHWTGRQHRIEPLLCTLCQLASTVECEAMSCVVQCACVRLWVKGVPTSMNFVHAPTARGSTPGFVVEKKASEPHCTHTLALTHTYTHTFSTTVQSATVANFLCLQGASGMVHTGCRPFIDWLVATDPAMHCRLVLP